MSMIIHSLTPAQFAIVIGLAMVFLGIGFGMGISFVMSLRGASYLRGRIDAIKRVAPRFQKLERDNTNLRAELVNLREQLRETKRANVQLREAYALIGKDHIVDATDFKSTHS